MHVLNTRSGEAVGTHSLKLLRRVDSLESSGLLGLGTCRVQKSKVLGSAVLDLGLYNWALPLTMHAFMQTENRLSREFIRR